MENRTKEILQHAAYWAAIVVSLLNAIVEKITQ